MKNKSLGIFLLMSALTIAGCGGKKGGSKTSFEKFEEAVNALPTTHPFIYAEISYNDSDYGKGVEKYDLEGGYWVAQGQAIFQSILYDTVQSQLPQIKEFVKQGQISTTFYVDPLAFEMSHTASEYGVTASVYSRAEWNNFGLPTYSKTEEKTSVQGQSYSQVSEYKITYRTAGGDTSAETSQSSQQSGNAPITPEVTEAEWNAQFLLDSQQNYAFQVTLKQNQYEHVITGSYDAGKIYYNDGVQGYYYNVLWNTVDSSTRTGNFESYRYESGAWYKSTFTAQRIDDLSECTLRVPFTYSYFTYDADNHLYKCPSETVFNVTFENIEVSFNNKKISRIYFETHFDSREATYEGIYSGYGQQRVTLPEATSGDTSAVEPQHNYREEFGLWAGSIDYAAHPFKTAYVSYETFDTAGSNSGEQTFTWNPTDKVWFSETSSPFSQLPTASTFIPEIESMEKQYGFTFDEKWGGDLKTVTMFGQFDQQGVAMYITVSAEFNDYGYATYYGMSARMNYQGQEYSSGSDFNISFAE